MAEAIAAISLAASIATFIDVSVKLLDRLREFQSTTQEMPGVFQDIMPQLPLIIRTMKQIKEGCGSWTLTADEQRELSDVVGGCHKQIALLKELIGKILPVPAESPLRRARKAITSVRKERDVAVIQKTLEGYKTTLTLYLCHHTALKGREDLKIRCRHWLRPSNVESIHQQQVRVKLHGTCNWVWVNPAFLKWNETTSLLASDRLLCIYGIHGCGKTVLASSIAEGLERKQLPALFFSFSGTDANRRDLNSLVRTFLWQLLEKTTYGQSLKIANDLLLKDPADTIGLLDCLKRVAEWVTGPVYCVIDGADECDNSTQELLDHILALLEALAGFRVVMLGRPHVFQATISATIQTIEMNSNLTREDIDAFIDSEIRNSPDLNLPELRDSIFDALQEKSDGMFLWVKLMVDDLRRAATPFEIADRLRNLPRGLGKAYRRVFSRLAGTLNDSELARARRILAFTIVSCRPLELDELRYAYALDSGSGSTFEEHLLRRPAQRILEVCGDFVNITDGLVQLTHISVKEFLTRPEEEWVRTGDQELMNFRVDLVASHHAFGSLCFDYIRMVEYSSPLHDTGTFLGLPTRYPFLSYASRHVISHLSQSGPLCSATLGKLRKFLGSKNCVYWIEYLAMLSLKEGSVSTLEGEFETFISWLDKGGYEQRLFEKDVRMCLNQELGVRIRTFGEHDPRTEQWQLLMCIILDTDANTDSEQEPTNCPPWIASREFFGLSQILKTLNGNSALPLHRQVDMLLRLQSYLQRTRVLTDPLKILFCAILQKAPILPVYMLLAVGVFYYRLDKLEEALEVYRTALAKVESQEVPIEFEIIGWIGHVLDQQDKYKEAEEMYRRALEGREKVLGKEHRDTLASVNDLGNALDGQGKHEEAEEIYQRALEGREGVLGKEHRDTLTSVNNLGNALYNQGRYEESEEMFRRALEGREKVLGKEHRNTLVSVNDLGNALDYQGKHEEAEEIYRRALEGNEKVLGKEHRDTLTSANNLGYALDNQGRHGESEEMFRRALEGRKKVLGEGHRNTLASTNGLGNALDRQGKHGEAEEIYRRALEGNEKVLGKEHRDTLASASGLGNTLDNQGKHEEAEEIHRRALEGNEKVLGKEHHDTLTSVNDLSNALDNQGKHEEAEEMYRRALEGNEKVLGKEHCNTLTSANNLGNALYNQGKHEEAEEIYQRALEGNEKVRGKEHCDTLTSINNLGNALYNQGKHEEAEEMYRRAMEGREKVLGKEHRNTLVSVNSFGNALDGQGKHGESEEMYRWALEGNEKVLGKEHHDTLTSVSNLGNALYNQGKHEEAEKMFRRELEGRERVLGKEHRDTLTSVNNLGNALYSQGKHEEAEKMFRRELEGREMVLGKEHRSTLVSANDLGNTLYNQGKYEEAEEMYRRALEGREKVLGKEHRDTLTIVNNLGNALYSQGKHEEAEEMFRRELEGNEKVLGKEHCDTLVSVNDLGNALYSQGKHGEAEEMYRRELEGREKVLGKEHRDTLTSVNNLGNALYNQGKHEEAEKMFRRELEGREKVLGKEHRDTLSSANDLGNVLNNQGKHAEAEKMLRRALEGRKKVLGNEHCDTLTSANDLGNTLYV